ncbi:MAG: hypothetical protein Athens071424_94 [Parcubacteria group bacterium Athens0714_24]|nr:MAG: hypothetical protein Athens071424_94 [Parcubacteria group bacterium Athens0714_24]
MLAFVENELGDLLQPFPRVRIEVRHEKKQSTFLIHQKRGEGEEDLYSFAWMKIIWANPKKEERVIFSTRKIHPDVRFCSIAEVYDTIREIVHFLEKYNTLGERIILLP